MSQSRLVGYIVGILLPLLFMAENGVAEEIDKITLQVPWRTEFIPADPGIGIVCSLYDANCKVIANEVRYIRKNLNVPNFQTIDIPFAGEKVKRASMAGCFISRANTTTGIVYGNKKALPGKQACEKSSPTVSKSSQQGASAPGSCAYSGECPAGYSCDKSGNDIGVCWDGSYPGAPASCTKDADCGFNYCLDGKCKHASHAEKIKNMRIDQETKDIQTEKTLLSEDDQEKLVITAHKWYDREPPAKCSVEFGECGYDQLCVKGNCYYRKEYKHRLDHAVRYGKNAGGLGPVNYLLHIGRGYGGCNQDEDCDLDMGEICDRDTGSCTPPRNWEARAKDFLTRKNRTDHYLAIGEKCSSKQECASNHCADGKVCAPEDHTGQTGMYCHHNNHCISGYCACPNGKSGAFCRNYEVGSGGTCQ